MNIPSKSGIVASVLVVLLAASACGGFGDPQFTEFVINRADRPFTVRYEWPASIGFKRSVTVPPHSRGAGLLGPGDSWRGVVVIMTSDCVPLGSFEITTNPSLVIIEADGSFSLVTEHIVERSDLEGSTLYEEVDCAAT